MKIKYVLLLTMIIVGCSYPQNQILPDQILQNRILFEGENIILVESSQSNFEQLPFEASKTESCFRETDTNIRKKLPGLGFNGNTKYFKFLGEEKNEQQRFTLRLGKENFARINLDSLKKFDSQASFTESNDLYFLKNKEYDYLVMIGRNIGASGYGHYYRVHTLLPLTSKKPMIEFDSLTDDPRKIRIDDSGRIYYVQIDSRKLGAIADVDTNNLPVTVSLFSFNGERDKKLEFASVCKNLD